VGKNYTKELTIQKDLEYKLNGRLRGNAKRRPLYLTILVYSCSG